MVNFPFESIVTKRFCGKPGKFLQIIPLPLRQATIPSDEGTAMVVARLGSAATCRRLFTWVAECDGPLAHLQKSSFPHFASLAVSG